MRVVDRVSCVTSKLLCSAIMILNLFVVPSLLPVANLAAVHPPAQPPSDSHYYEMLLSVEHKDNLLSLSVAVIVPDDSIMTDNERQRNSL